MFAFSIYDSMRDWENTIVRFELEEKGESIEVLFSHTGWPDDNDHFRTSSFCWAMYLRLMKKYVEEGMVVEYAMRLEA